MTVYYNTSTNFTYDNHTVRVNGSKAIPTQRTIDTTTVDNQNLTRIQLTNRSVVSTSSRSYEVEVKFSAPNDTGDKIIYSGGTHGPTGEILPLKETTVAIENSDDESSDSGGGGGGGGDGGGGGSVDQGPPSVQDVRSTLNLVTATTSATLPLEDTDNSQSGLTVSTEEPTTVDEVTFNNEELSGTMEVTEYTEPPQTIREDVATSVAADFEARSSSSAGTLSDPTEISVLAVSDIAPTVAATEDSSATVNLSVDSNQVNNPKQLQVVKETYSEEAQATRWNQLSIQEQSTVGGEITMTVEVDSFSLFAITEVEGASQTSRTTTTNQNNNDTNENDGIETIGIVGVLAVVLITGVALYLKD
jgi:hypothetical protein